MPGQGHEALLLQDSSLVFKQGHRLHSGGDGDCHRTVSSGDGAWIMQKCATALGESMQMLQLDRLLEYLTQ